MTRALLALLAVAALTGCGTEVDLTPLSDDVGGSDERLVLTFGVASLVQATDDGDELDADRVVEVTSADPAVVGVLDGEAVHTFVLVGHAVGTTTLHIDLDGKLNRDLPVEVIDR